MIADLMRYISDKGFRLTAMECVRSAKREIEINWNKLNWGDCLLIANTNPGTYEESVKYNVYKTIYQIDGPPKFTVGNVTVIRKTSDLILTDGVIEWEGFDTFREVILHLVTWDEAIKIIDTWK